VAPIEVLDWLRDIMTRFLDHALELPASNADFLGEGPAEGCPGSGVRMLTSGRRRSRDPTLTAKMLSHPVKKGSGFLTRAGGNLPARQFLGHNKRAQ
jgi:hypothetical protein